MFAFILAGHLKMTVETLMETMTCHEFVSWQVFHRREPFGTLAEDVRATLYPALKINSCKKPSDTAVKPLDLLPWRHPDAFKPKVAAPAPKGRKGALMAALKRILGKDGQ